MARICMELSEGEGVAFDGAASIIVRKKSGNRIRVMVDVPDETKIRRVDDLPRDNTKPHG